MNLTHTIQKTIGLISDTHGLLRPEALSALEGSELILHAGDIGSPDVLENLRAIAPVIAVRGNNDREAWAKEIPEMEVIEIGSVLLYVIHDVQELDLEPASAGFAAVISGHSHRPSITELRGVHFINPGSAGPRRFKLPISVGRLTLSDRGVKAELIELDSNSRAFHGNHEQ
jgi:uncharacterized protein